MLREVGPAGHERLIPLLQALDMNTLFARAVLEGYAPGRVYADSEGSPSVVYVIHGYGMSLLSGEADDRILSDVMSMRRSSVEWLQVSPGPLAARFAQFPVERHTRVNFRFSADAYRARRLRQPETAYRTARADRSVFAMPGAVVPRAFWSDVERFMETGAGYAVMVDGQAVSLAFSSFVNGSQLELGIETLEQHRGRGLAAIACAALIDHCLERDLEPVWACRLENTASHRLAEALGFTPVRHLPYFRLPPAPGPTHDGA